MKKNIAASLFLLILLTIQLSFAFFSVNAQEKTTVATYASISVNPNPVEQNKGVTVSLSIQPPPPLTSDNLAEIYTETSPYIFHNLTLTLTSPNGTTTNLGAWSTHPNGTRDAWPLSITDTPGSYILKLTFPGQTFSNGTIQYLPSENQTALIVDYLPAPPPASQVGSWTLKASLSQGRTGLGVVAFGDKIYAIGGETETGYMPNTLGNDYNAKGWIVKTNQEYDTTTGRWTNKASMPTARYNFAIAACQGKIYCTGGITDYNPGYYTNTTQVNEAYDPATNMWETKAPAPA